MRLLISSLFLLLFGSLMAQSGSSLWTMKSRAWVESQGQEMYVQPATGRYATLDLQEVRRQLLGLYGEDQLYGGGLSVRTTLDPKLQEIARKALMDGLIAYDHDRDFREPVASIELGQDWGQSVYEIKPLRDLPEWQLAVVL